jgi:MFS family permease
MAASDELTPAESAFVWRARLMKMLWEGGFGLGGASLNMKLMRLSGGDTAAIAAAHAAHWSLTSAGKCVISPAYGALSDTTGRRVLWALGRLGMCVQFATWWGCGSVRGFVIGHTLSWGLLPLDGSLKVEDAAWSDVFGDRPDLSSKLLAQNQVYTSLAGLVSPIVGAQLARYGENYAFMCGIAIGAAQCLLAATTPETLAKEKRLKFNASKINPLKGLGLLFTHGAGLRRLVIAGGLFRACQTIYATIDSYRLGPIGWSPAEQSYFSAGLSGVNIMTTQWVSKPLFAKLGARRTFQTSSLVAAVAYLAVSQACRPAGAAAQMRRTVQFLVAKAFLMTPWSEPSHFAVLRELVVAARVVLTAEAVLLASLCPLLCALCSVLCALLASIVYADAKLCACVCCVSRNAFELRQRLW